MVTEIKQLKAAFIYKSVKKEKLYRTFSSSVAFCFCVAGSSCVLSPPDCGSAWPGVSESRSRLTLSRAPVSHRREMRPHQQEADLLFAHLTSSSRAWKWIM